MTTTTTKPSPACRRWIDRIDTGTFSQSHCRAFARNVYPMVAWSPDALARMVYGRTPTTLTVPEANSLVNRIFPTGVRLTDEHTAIGLAWLRKYGARPSTWWCRPFPTERLEAFSHFTFAGIGWDPDDRGFSSVPLYRVHFTDGGRTIDYWRRAWQSGGGAEWWPTVAS